MTDYKLVPVEMIKRAAVTLERFAYDTFDGRNLAHELSELLTEAPAINIVATKNEQGQIVSVTLQDGDHRILEVIAEAGVQGEPLGYVVPRMAARLGKGELCGISVLDKPEDGHTLPVYLTPQPAEQQPAPDVAGLVEALESLLRHAKKMGRTSARYDKARAALAAHRKKGGE